MMKINPKIKEFFLFVLLMCITFPLLAFAEDAAEEPKQCPPFETFNNWEEALFLEAAYQKIRDVFVPISNIMWGISLDGVVIVGIAIYIALATLKNVGSFSQQEVGAYLTADKKGVIPLAIKGTFIVFLLNNRGFVYDYLVSPIVSAGGEIGGSSYGRGGAGDVGGLFNMAINIAKDFLRQIYKITAFGRMLLCLAFLPESILEWHWVMIPFGAVLFLFGWLLILGVSFYLLDVLFRMGVGCAVLPLGIACGTSKLTSYYTKQTWNLFINVAFNFVMLGIIIQFTGEMITRSISGINNGTNIAEILEKVGGKVPDDSDIQTLKDALSFIGFIILVLACMITFKLFTSVEQVADKVSLTSSVGKMGQEAASKVADKAQGLVKQAIKGEAQAIGQAIDPSGATGKALASSVDSGGLGGKIANSEAGRGVRKGWRQNKDRVKKLLRLKDDEDGE